MIRLTSRRSQPPLALAVPLSRFTSQVGGGSAFFVRRSLTRHAKDYHSRPAHGCPRQRRFVWPSLRRVGWRCRASAGRSVSQQLPHFLEEVWSVIHYRTSFGRTS